MCVRERNDKMNRICLTPTSALQFAQLPMILRGDDKLVEAALQIRAATLSGAYIYVSVWVITGPGTEEEVRIRIAKEID